MDEVLTYHVEDFDGPLDLLLHLIKINEMDIFDIPIVDITQQYLEFLHNAEAHNLDVGGDFLVMAATLMSIKASYLLPQPEIFESDMEMDALIEQGDPREELMQQLLEYQQYQEAAEDLRELEGTRQQQFSRAAMDVPFDIDAEPLPVGLELDDLQAAFKRLLQKRTVTEQRGQTRTMRGETWSVRQQMNLLMQRVMEERTVTFDTLFATHDSRDKIVTTFLGLLELVRHQHLLVAQVEEFGTITFSAGTEPYTFKEEGKLADDESTTN
ncbi:segregation and condensation protein A [Weissella tructae]|uniref:Segregation and condensation protein A n=2 Tax=Weissella TaxID=46255 RepID=A0A075TVT1_9LACO|nr:MULTISPECIES: segregation/condensation protein A [Weissella]AIG65669.1 Segregation and condensation protein A [Weissella tructae]AIM62984.1 Segregation and condensation protein A [Weissella ceti]AIM64383.1 Segregation and condensation protein A [Weissella ceti]ELA06877.1 segregation and condensation protein A [Weissella ceti NC36]QVV90789.1 segregation/condensation protein A [Weissella tructae]